jgi:hypothetical protein
MIRTRVFFYNVILEVAEKRVCPIEHTSIFFLCVRCLAATTHCGSRLFGAGREVWSFCRDARENWGLRHQFQLFEIPEHALPADIVLLRFDRSR